MRSHDEIRKNIIEEIQWAPQLSNVAAQVSVIVKDEIVTLSGAMRGRAQSVTAESAVQRVTGVKAGVVGMKIKETEELSVKGDAYILEAARSALEMHSAIDEEFIDVKVNNGCVFLIGIVNWDYERNAAERAIANILGVKGVINEIGIREKVIEPLEIQSKIRAAFYRHASIDSSDVSVAVVGNIISLTGKVRSLAGRKDAEDVAWSVPGVDEVENRLEIDTEILADRTA